jgi:hypothetical protein
LNNSCWKAELDYLLWERDYEWCYMQATLCYWGRRNCNGHFCITNRQHGATVSIYDLSKEKD